MFAIFRMVSRPEEKFCIMCDGRFMMTLETKKKSSVWQTNKRLHRKHGLGWRTLSSWHNKQNMSWILPARGLCIERNSAVKKRFIENRCTKDSIRSHSKTRENQQGFLIDWLSCVLMWFFFSNKLEIHHSHEETQHVFPSTWSNTITLLVQKNRHKFFYALILHCLWFSLLDSFKISWIFLLPISLSFTHLKR